MVTVKNNTDADNNVSINQVSNGTKGITNISVGGKVTINDVEYECITSKSGGTKFYPKGDYHKMKQAQQATGNYNAYADGRNTNTKYWSQEGAPQHQGAPRGNSKWWSQETNPWGRRETYEDWVKRLKEEKKSEEPQDQVEDDLVDSIRKEIQAIQASAIVLTKKMAEIKCREQSIRHRENTIQHNEAHVSRRIDDLLLKEKQLEQREIDSELFDEELTKLDLELVEREAVIEEWERLHATPNTTSEGPNDVRKRASRL